MKSKWSASDAAGFQEKCGNPDSGMRLYTTRLLGSEKDLVLYGGGNTSVKSVFTDVMGREIPSIYVKASGCNMAEMTEEDFVLLDLAYLSELRSKEELSDQQLRQVLRTHLLQYSNSVPSVEAMMHVFIPGKFVDHTHPSSILALVNRENGVNSVKEALGEDVATVPYIKAGFGLARAVLQTLEKNPSCSALVLLHHGLITWGETAQKSYEKTINLVTRAEKYLDSKLSKAFVQVPVSIDTSSQLYRKVAPLIRGVLSGPTGNPDLPRKRIILAPLLQDSVRAFMDMPESRGLALQPPLTPDYLIRTRPFSLWIDKPDYQNFDHLREQISDGVKSFVLQYEEYIRRHRTSMPSGTAAFDSYPLVVFLPGLGVVCAGSTAKDAAIARDITEQTIRVKSLIFKTGGKYKGLSEGHLFEMEYHSFQIAKVKNAPSEVKREGIALITGAAGAIGSGISVKLLEAGWHVAVTDLPGKPLDTLLASLKERFPDRVMAVALDVTSRESVEAGFETIAGQWGGLDLVVVNAGIAHVSPLTDMDLAIFQKLERVNIDGTLLLIGQAGRHFALQQTGGDIILISTKNVFAPGAKFGAYSATKAASHQLARIASLELAGIGVRVNMVAPDAVFSHGETKSGLWSAVGPDRMKARGLDEKGLEEYYRNRNLLKAQVTSDHVASAVLFFANRLTPTTGATIPVDGGLPDAAPR
ncbi:MAG: bifunctional aldolase/short-chain dehydrogenase [Fibrobacter sp.]|nr:bifunctional aldolase/short-chain dehydrogenase [Fibrobacter sp.]